MVASKPASKSPLGAFAGKYPVEAVKTMAKIAAQAEKDKLAENDIRIPLDENSNDVTAFLAKQAVKATSKLNIRAIITDSFSWLPVMALLWLHVIRCRSMRFTYLC